MPYALIAPKEKSYSGQRVVQIESQPFEVAAPLFWKECDVGLYRGVWYYDPDKDDFVSVSQSNPIDESGTAPDVIG
jgi:hypothetical protein